MVRLTPCISRALALFLVVTFSAVEGSAVPDGRVAAVAQLISRRFGAGVEEKFDLEIIPKNAKGMDVLEIGGPGPKIRLAGSSGTALASALYWYIKTVLKRQVSWDAKDPELPTTLPIINAKVRMERMTKYSYYQNVCTVSYSMWSWSWEQWERHLDWMALNGINLPLAFTGQEYIWATVFRDHFGISEQGLDDFFSGASFLAWNRMGNVRGPWGPGALPTEFINSQHNLQMQILKRMKELDITPVLPGFAGHVPEELQAKFPSANITLAPNWGNFPPENCCVRTLEPSDPLFHKIGMLFIQEQRKAYGGLGSSIYQMDTYNEMQPRSGDHPYLAASANALFNAMRAGDPQGVWMMQGWLFISGWWDKGRVEAYLSAVPDSAMIILDLYSEVAPQWKTYNNFFGKPWIYCVLHNFGGNLGLRGNLPKIGQDVIASYEESKGGMVGVGITMEGIFQNYVVYHLTLEMAWRAAPIVDIGQWVKDYSTQRYAGAVAGQVAWEQLLETAYNCSSGWGVTKSLVELRPAFKLDAPGGFMPRVPPYTLGSMVPIWTSLLGAVAVNPDIQGQDAFLYDVVDVTRQALSDIFLGLYRDAVAAFEAARSPSTVCNLTLRMRQILTDMDRILSTHKGFLLGCWEADATALANGDEKLKDYFLYQARNQVTRWGAEGEITDYASKQWAGLVSGYYARRWDIWLGELCDAAREARDFDTKGTLTAIQTFESQWQYGPADASCDPSGTPVQVSKELWQRYAAGGSRAHPGGLSHVMPDMDQLMSPVSAAAI